MISIVNGHKPSLQVCEEWRKFYSNFFGLEVDFSQVMISPKPVFGEWMLIFIPKGLNLNLAFKVYSKLFNSTNCYNNLNEHITKNVRDTNCDYAVWVQDEVEPDREFLGKSAKQSDPDMKLGVTLLERIILGVRYLTETGNHLDIRGMTICSGSRDSEGFIPIIYWCKKGKVEERVEVSCILLNGVFCVSGIRAAQ
ncbi:MAG: hypothetical protein WAV23_01595 [Minisyncoccia bacterium]